MPKNKKRKLIISLDKLEKEYLDALKKRTGKSSKDIIKLALASLFEKLLLSSGQQQIVVRGAILPQSLPNDSTAKPLIIMDHSTIC